MINVKLKDYFEIIHIKSWSEAGEIVENMLEADLNMFFFTNFSHELDEIIQSYIELAAEKPLISVRSEDKNIKQLVDSLEMIIDQTVSYEFSEVESDIDAFLEANFSLPGPTSNSPKTKNEEVPKATAASTAPSKEEVKTHEEVEADYSLKHESKEHQELEADYSLKHESKEHEEVEADYSLKHESKEHEELEADYSLKHESKEHEEVEADYSLKHESKEHEELEADYSLKHESKEHEEVEADYSLKGIGKTLDSKEQVAKDKVDNIDKETNETSELYRKIRITKIRNLKELKMDIFLRTSAKKFIRVLNNQTSRADEIQEICKKYEERFFTYFYLLKDDHQLFIDAQVQQVKNALSNMALDAKTRATGSLVVLSGIKDKVQELGITEAVVEDVKMVMDQTEKIFKKSKNLSDLFGKVMKGKNYISEHSLMVPLIMAQISSKITWMNKASLEKISMAALLHDSTLSNEKLSVYTDLNDSNLSKEDKKEVSEHPYKVANMIRNSGLVLADVDNIIEHHHEKPDGSGFPRGINSAQISPLSACFIICEKFTKDFLAGKKVDAIKEDLSANYNKGNFRNVVTAVLESF